VSSFGSVISEADVEAVVVFVFVGVFAAEASLGALDRFVCAMPLPGLVVVVRLGAERISLVGDLVFDAVARDAARGGVPVVAARAGWALAEQLLGPLARGL
jgi:hypothetical protein